MIAKLFCKYGPMSGAEFTIENEVVIGRLAPSAVLISHTLVSSRHARIFHDRERGCWMLEDLGSLNGTLLDGSPISEPQALGPLHVINFGGCADFFFQEQAGAAPKIIQKQAASAAAGKPAAAAKSAGPSDTFSERDAVRIPDMLKRIGEGATVPIDEDLSAEKVITEVGPAAPMPAILAARAKRPDPAQAPEADASAGPKYRLTIVNIGERPLVFDLGEGEHVVGREPGLAIPIPSHEISRRHAVITVRGDAVSIRDEGSLNHTYLNRKPVTGETPVHEGDILYFSKIEARLAPRDQKPGQGSEP